MACHNNKPQAVKSYSIEIDEKPGNDSTGTIRPQTSSIRFIAANDTDAYNMAVRKFIIDKVGAINIGGDSTRKFSFVVRDTNGVNLIVHLGKKTADRLYNKVNQTVIKELHSRRRVTHLQDSL